jgi:uncharacterized protein YllA (UPF0747 family)
MLRENTNAQYKKESEQRRVEKSGENIPVNAGVVKFCRDFLNEKVTIKPAKVSQHFITRN